MICRRPPAKYLASLMGISPATTSTIAKAETDVSQRKRFPISRERRLVVSMIDVFVSAMSCMDRGTALIPAHTVPSMEIKPTIAVRVVSVISTSERFLERLGWPTVLMQPLIGPGFHRAGPQVHRRASRCPQ